MVEQVRRITLLTDRLEAASELGWVESPSFVLLAATLMLGFAGYRLPRMSVDVFPELNAPTVVIMAEAGGLAADEVEKYVTFPIETAANGMSGVRRVRSASAIGLSMVWVDLDWGADLYDARQLIAERLVTIRGAAAGGHLRDLVPSLVQ